TSKVAAGLLLLMLGVLGSTLLLYLASWYRGYLLDPKSLFTAAAITWMGAVLVYLAVLIFSVLFSSPVKAGAAAALFILALSLPAYFEATESYSLLYYMKAVPYWQEGQTPLVPLGFFLVAGGLLYETGVILYDR
ncbi:MAG TPA: hypothetical protein PKO38_09135, partial [Bacillota bacterium]|nr:hypothetical protein [Bacillota bacterium]